VPAPAPGRSPNNINPVDPQSANRPLVTITEDAQQPSITKPAQQPSRPTSNCVRRLITTINIERDVQDEWTFVKSHHRQKFKLVPKLLVQGFEAANEAGLAGCGIIRVAACDIEDELRSRALVPVLPDWECTGMSRRVAIYRKTRPMPPQVSLFVRHLANAFRRFNVR
jgi:DNA-binding transcriptional LysR family regulator